MQPQTQNEVVIGQYGMCNWLMDQYLEGMTDAESLQPGPTGNSINWLVGHLALARNHALFALTGARPWPVEELDRYAKGKPAATDTTGVLPLADLKARYAGALGTITEKLAAMTPEEAAATAPFSPLGNPKETLASLFTTLAFHEGYHIGQIGMLRRAIGKPGLM